MLVPRGSGMYIGWPGSSAIFRAAGTVLQLPGWLATSIVASADGLALSSVRPRSVRARAWPRSTLRLPVQEFGHQSVPASPSTALAAGSPDSADVAVACPDRAQFSVVAEAATPAVPAVPVCPARAPAAVAPAAVCVKPARACAVPVAAAVMSGAASSAQAPLSASRRVFRLMPLTTRDHGVRLCEFVWLLSNSKLFMGIPPCHPGPVAEAARSPGQKRPQSQISA